MNRTDMFALLLLFLVIAGTLFTYYLTREQYTHAPLDRECSEPYAYPICQRAGQPAVQQEPGLRELYLGTVFMAVLAFILVILSFTSSVFRQADLNVTGANPQPRQAAKQTGGGSGTPDAIPRNTMRQDEVVRNG